MLKSMIKQDKNSFFLFELKFNYSLDIFSYYG